MRYCAAVLYRRRLVDRLRLHSSLRKGDSVVVFGKFLMRSYEAKDGAQRTVYEIDAITVGPDLNRWPADLRRPARPAEALPPAEDPAESTAAAA
jgi:single-stranded DNA-binding protein